jgi:hypothetical protein
MVRARLLGWSLVSDNATDAVPDTEMLMFFTKTKTRALAASVAFVAAGATVAGAAVFQLPILGFGRAQVASATATPVDAKPAVTVVRRKIEPKVVVRTRYVTDIVHRRAQARTESMPAAAPTAGFVASPHVPAMATSTTIVPSFSTSTSPTTAWSEDDSDGFEHESESDAGQDPDPDRDAVSAPVVEDQ